MIRRLSAMCILVGMLCSQSASGVSWVAYVTGFDSDNLFSFDLATGQSKLVMQYASGYGPRGVAVDSADRIFISFNGGAQNVIRFDPAIGGTYTWTALTGKVGNYGPAFLAMYNNELFVAGDSERRVLRINPDTGASNGELVFGGSYNIVGINIAGDQLYVNEYFQGRVGSFDLTNDTARYPIIDTNLVNHSAGVTVGHNGNLFITDLEVGIGGPKIYQFDITTGASLGVFADLTSEGLAGLSGLQYVPQLHSYYVAQGDGIYQIDEAGNLVTSFHHQDLLRAFALTVVLKIPPGDVNGDGMVNLADLQILGDNWHSTTATRAQGDFTFDGYVGLADLQIIADNWGIGAPADVAFDEALGLAGLPVPEPACLVLLAAAGACLVSRRSGGLRH